MNRGSLFIICGPSGSGKSTLIKKFLAENPQYIFPTSVTTRTAREGEVNGDHYFFIHEKEFIEKKENEEFLEWANVYGKYYGTLKSTILNGLDEGKKFIKDIDLQGARALFKLLNRKDFKSIFVSPPSMEILKKRLQDRESETEETLNKRLKTAEEEMLAKGEFDTIITNDNFDQAYKEFCHHILKIE